MGVHLAYTLMHWDSCATYITSSLKSGSEDGLPPNSPMLLSYVVSELIHPVKYPYATSMPTCVPRACVCSVFLVPVYEEKLHSTDIGFCSLRRVQDWWGCLNNFSVRIRLCAKISTLL